MDRELMENLKAVGSWISNIPGGWDESHTGKSPVHIVYDAIAALSAADARVAELEGENAKLRDTVEQIEVDLSDSSPRVALALSRCRRMTGDYSNG